MAGTAMFSALPIPTVTSRPSLSCLQWSEDGQLLFLSKGSVYILTPDRGVPTSNQLPGDVGPPHRIKWYSTMIDFNLRDVCYWPAGSQDWGALSLGSMDVGLRAISCSPGNLTENGGCVVAILTSNMDVSLWHAVKDRIKGEWLKICEVTPLIMEFVSRESHSKTEQTLRSQVTSLLWSSHADFGATRASSVGTRGGTLILLRYKNSSLEPVATVKVSDEWITHVAFSPWTAHEACKSEAAIAFAAADGSVGLVTVIQTLSSTPTASGFFLNYGIETCVEKTESAVFQPDKMGVTALSWISFPNQRILVRATPGVIALWAAPSTNLRWFGSRSLRLCTQDLSVGSSSFQPVTGLHYVRQEDALFVSLFDGSIHVINSVSAEPKLSDASMNLDGNIQTSPALSSLLRSVFVGSTKTKISNSDMSRVSGMIPCDERYSVAAWVYEWAQPANFEYKYDVLHESTLVGKRIKIFSAARICDPPTSDMILHELSTILTAAKASSGSTPLKLLRPIFLHAKDIIQRQPDVIKILLADVDNQPLSGEETPAWLGDLNSEFRLDFRRSLKQSLYGCNALLSLRLRLCMAEFSWRHTAEQSQRENYNEVAQQLLRTISFTILSTIARHATAVVSCLTENDIPFLMRIALQASQSNVPVELASNARSLIAGLESHIPSFSTENYQKQAMQETCPACGLMIWLDDGSEGTCSRGHSWARCSVTTFLLSTPNVRTCSGCTRKAFLPVSSCGSPEFLPYPARSWLVEEFLEAASRCLFCGNFFSSVL
ncbi:transcription factor IIIC subunit delta N-term-domain-containing protein [Favolaschia claudopus]|uniref:Transcription factor IIIC subunit delta N-term-domain-containing protein n=1 Tax=Favolaschia claudopus TaxID=2862362 RepID=A0AAW0BWP5_9AGAR